MQGVAVDGEAVEVVEAARKHKARMAHARELRHAIGDKPATFTQLTALASGMSESTYSGHTHAWSPATALAARAAASLRDENRRLRSLLDSKRRIWRDSKQPPATLHYRVHLD